MNMYGTTLRGGTRLRKLGASHGSIPCENHREGVIGTVGAGRDVVQVGGRFDGTPTRWMYTEITPDSFHWLGEALETDGKTEARGRVPCGKDQ